MYRVLGDEVTQPKGGNMKWTILVQAPREQWLQFPGFAPSPTQHELTVEAATEPEARELGLAESMYPDGRVLRARPRYLWRITLRRKDDRRRRETFVVATDADLAVEPTVAERLGKNAVARARRPWRQFGAKPEIVKVERAGLA